MVKNTIIESKIHEWKAIFEKYSPILKPNRKSVPKIVELLNSKYPLEKDLSNKSKKVVEGNVLNNFYGTRLQKGEPLDITVFSVKNEGNAKSLYKMQKEPFKGVTIMIGAETNSGYVYVEGSPELADEITTLQGLDSEELTNYFLVANYIRCMKEAGKLESIT